MNSLEERIDILESNYESRAALDFNTMNKALQTFKDMSATLANDLYHIKNTIYDITLQASNSFSVSNQFGIVTTTEVSSYAKGACSLTNNGIKFGSGSGNACYLNSNGDGCKFIPGVILNDTQNCKYINTYPYCVGAPYGKNGHCYIDFYNVNTCDFNYSTINNDYTNCKFTVFT